MKKKKKSKKIRQKPVLLYELKWRGRRDFTFNSTKSDTHYGAITHLEKYYIGLNEVIIDDNKKKSFEYPIASDGSVLGEFVFDMFKQLVNGEIFQYENIYCPLSK